MALFFNALFNFMISIANFFLAPINLIISNAFPDFSDMVYEFEMILNNYIIPPVGWLLSILPPYARSLIGVYVGLLITFYTLSLAIHVVIKIIEIIKAVKIW